MKIRLAAAKMGLAAGLELWGCAVVFFELSLSFKLVWGIAMEVLSPFSLSIVCVAADSTFQTQTIVRSRPVAFQ